MDQETTKRLEALESRVLRLESQPAATLRKKSNRKPLTDEQKKEHVKRLRVGKVAAKARREAEAQEKPPQVKAIVETAKKEVKPATVEFIPTGKAAKKAEADAKRDMASTKAKRGNIKVKEAVK